MPKLNKNLIRSILDDLKALESTCNEIFKWVGDTDSMSWRYPTQKCNAIHINSILYHYTGSACECYLLVLELIYDRFHYLLHLLVKFMDMIPVISEKFGLPRNVICPGHLSVGALLSMLWARNEAINNYFLESMVKNGTKADSWPAKNKSQSVHIGLGAVVSSQSVSTPAEREDGAYTRCTQTSDCSLTICECCHISEEMMKRLINEIESKCSEFEVTSTVSNERENIKKHIYTMSQWGAMKNWTEAVWNDTERIIVALSKERERVLTLETMMKTQELKLEEKLSQKSNEISCMEKNLHSLQTQLDAEKSRVAKMMQEFVLQDVHMKKLKDDLEEVQVRLNNTEKLQTELFDCNSFLESELKKLAYELGISASNIGEYGEILEKWRGYKSECEDQKRDLKNRIQETLFKLQTQENTYKFEYEKLTTLLKEEKERTKYLASELQSVHNYIPLWQDAQLKNNHLVATLNASEERVNSLLSVTSQLENELEQSRMREKVLLEYPEMNTNVKSEVHGNPERDMECQIQANQIRIKLLAEQTTKLEGTLCKLRKIRQSS